MQRTGISQAEFYAAVESLRVDGPTVWDIRWSEASSEVDDRIRFQLRHNLVLVTAWTEIRLLHDLRRLFHAENLPCRLFFSYRRVACIHKDMNIARLQNGNPFRHDCSPPGRKSCIYIKQPNSSKSRISAICAKSCFLSCNTLVCAIKTWKNISASFIFAGGDPLVLFEGTDKVAQIIKAIPIWRAEAPRRCLPWRM